MNSRALIMSVETEVENMLDEANAELVSTSPASKEWTRTIKSKLAELGRRKGHHVYASGATNAHGGGWLYDLCWLSSAEETFVNVELAMECEWLRDDHLLDDFSKLCQCRATLRVMVYQAWALEDSKKLSARFKHQIERCASSVAGDRYLLSCWINEERKFRHEQIRYL